MRVLLAINPDAGGATDATSLVERARELLPTLEVIELSDLGELSDVQIGRILVAGGDGSIGSAFAAAHRCRAMLGVIPTGTANDFASALALPTEPSAALALALEPEPHVTALWGGTLDGRPFVNTAGVGLAVDATTRAAALKARLGPLAYPAGAVLAAARPPVVRARLAVDGAPAARGRVHQLLFGATGRFGGGAGLETADPTLPHLAATWIPARSRIALVRRAIGMLRHRLERQGDVHAWQAEDFTVTATLHGRPAEWNLDGEVIRPAGPAVQIAAIGPVAVITPESPSQAATPAGTLGD